MGSWIQPIPYPYIAWAWAWAKWEVAEVIISDVGSPRQPGSPFSLVFLTQEAYCYSPSDISWKLQILLIF